MIGDFLTWLLFDLLFKGIFYWPGWVALRILPLGRYPRRHEAHNVEFVAMCGFVAILLPVILFVTRST